MWKKTWVSASHIKGLEKSIDQSQSRLAGSGAISNCVESFCFLPFSCLLLSPKRGMTMSGMSLLRKGNMPSLHAWDAGLCDCKVLISPWLAAGAGFTQGEEPWYEASKQWFSMAWPGLQYTQEIGAVEKSAHGKRTVSVNYELWTFLSACSFS